jgi:hypothetical protein
MNVAFFFVGHGSVEVEVWRVVEGVMLPGWWWLGLCACASREEVRLPSEQRSGCALQIVYIRIQGHRDVRGLCMKVSAARRSYVAATLIM